ncbi:MAG: hypothetical protein MUC77_04605 [Chromatiaceae bacterium]|nr:hypothetical protein [Chromatiaceae bacterium]
MSAVPDGFKGHDRYSIKDAARIWAAAAYSMPWGLDWKEEKKFARELRLAEQELRDNVPVQTEKYTVKVTKSYRDEYLPRGYLSHGSWIENRPSTIEVDEDRTREFFLGTDLAAYAATRGKPGVFGFDEKPEKDLHPKERGSLLDLVYVMAQKYGKDLGPYSIAEKVLQDAQLLGVSISKDTIKKYIEEARARRE